MTIPDRKEVKDNWDKAKIIAEIAKIIAIICVGVVINTTLNRREQDLKYIQLAVGILQTKPNETVSGLREWAVEIIDSHSDTPLNDEAKKELLQNQLPSIWDDRALWKDSDIWKD